MLRSLRARLLFVTVTVAVSAAAAVGLLSRRTTLMEFNRYIGGDPSRFVRARDLLADHLRQPGGWRDAQPVLDRMADQASARVIAIDRAGAIAAASPSDLVRAHLDVGDHTITLREDHDGLVRETTIAGPPPLTLDGPPGTGPLALYFLPRDRDDRPDDQKVFVGSVTRSLGVAAGVVCLLTVIVSLLASRGVLGPVEALTTAVRRIGAGDLSRRVEVRSSDEIGELARAFNTMAESLARAEQARRNMANDVAHELRTPLSNIRCQLEAIQDGLSPPSQRVVDSLHEETMQLSRLVDDLQDLSLAEAGELRIVRQALDLREEIDRAVQATRAGLAPDAPVLSADVPSDVPLVAADPRRVRQILANLLSNAVQNTPREGRIDVTARATPAWVEVRVRDTGGGISPQHLPHVFDRFYRADASRERATGGAGLGLAIVQQLVRAHGGEVRAESSPGAGATFTFTLPVSHAT